jgi:hypothetical protein
MLEKKLKQIPKKELVEKRWYLGRGRNANLGYWDGNHFLTICDKMGQWVVKFEPYYEAESGCFQPFMLIDEGEMIEPFGEDAWNKHYGKTLKIILEE